jgi:N-methylhydantoinase B
MRIDPVRLEVMKNLFISITEEMGAVLKRASYSPNIKERMDASCALFDWKGRLVAQAEHIPVHLGSMPLAIQVIKKFYGENELEEGDQVILNDPYSGGSHLPDITLIKPVFLKEEIAGYVVNKAHHADIGGMSPGSMPGTSSEIFQEGLRIPPSKLLIRGKENRDLFRIIEFNTRTPEERLGDLRAQIAANNLGERRLISAVKKYGVELYRQFVDEMIAYSERRMRKAIREIPNGVYWGEDYMDNDGTSDDPIKVVCTVKVENETISVDFTGTSTEREANINAPYSVTLSSVYYAVRCVTDPYVPPNHGCYIPLSINIPKGTFLNPSRYLAVSAGNVETSQRIVDVLFIAFSKVIPERVPAQSCGSMNNVLIGGRKGKGAFTYYETIGGGQGARPKMDGQDGIHDHMTNTANTPVEVIETAYPIFIERYELIPDSCGLGKMRGGLGIKRVIRILTDATLSVQSERRKFRPVGLHGGKDGSPGRNYVIREGKVLTLPSKVTIGVKKNDLIVIETPGGGGYGLVKERDRVLIERDIVEGKVTMEKYEASFHGPSF